MPTRFAQSGFSLLEVLVAFAVFAITLGTILAVVSANVRVADLSASHGQATLIAESVVERIGADIPARAGAVSGTEADFRWALTLADRPEPVSGARMRLLDVAVRVSWGEGARARSIDLQTAIAVPSD